jgi:hypothetical protein
MKLQQSAGHQDTGWGVPGAESHSTDKTTWLPWSLRWKPSVPGVLAATVTNT